jgi:hypothetical protein
MVIFYNVKKPSVSKNNHLKNSRFFVFFCTFLGFESFLF